MAVEYAKNRVQFGQPIAGFQAVKHMCAEMLTHVETARSILYYSAWAQDRDEEEATLSASAAKVYVSRISREVSNTALQILGGIGFSWEHELHVYLKRAKCLGAMFGGEDVHLERLAQRLDY